MGSSLPPEELEFQKVMDAPPRVVPPPAPLTDEEREQQWKISSEGLRHPRTRSSSTLGELDYTEWDAYVGRAGRPRTAEQYIDVVNKAYERFTDG